MSSSQELAHRKERAATWFRTLRDDICSRFEQIETELELQT